MPLARHKEETESNDFDRVFRPFALRKGVEVAPVNYFDTPREGLEEKPIVVSDGRPPHISLLGVVFTPFRALDPLTPHCKTVFAT